MSEKYYKLPVSEISKTPTTGGMYELYHSYYWLIDKDNNVFVNKKTGVKLANVHEQLVKRLVNSKPIPEAVDIKYIEFAWFEHDCQDY